MKKLLNTLYVTSENSYLGLDGENVVVYEEKEEIGRLPLHNLEGIVSFGYRGVSPALMGGCAERNVSLCFLSPQGKFLARVTGKVKGNVILRQRQYDSSRSNRCERRGRDLPGSTGRCGLRLQRPRKTDRSIIIR